MNVTTESLRSSFQMLDAMTGANLRDVTAEMAGRRPVPTANNATWVLGHIVFWRSRMLEMLGAAPVWTQGEGTAFEGMKKGDPPSDPGRAFEEVLGDLEESRKRLGEALEGEVPDAVRGDLLSLALHEAYHVGQIGLLRRTMGLSGAIGG